MASIIGGFETGLLDSSLFLLNRNDRTRAGQTGHEENIFVNAANGNLVVRHTDAFLPSQGEDFSVVRTYNSRGRMWSISSIVLELSQINNNVITLINDDVSRFLFFFDAASGQYRSVDGAGAYEFISQNKPAKTWVLVRSDQTVLTFDNNGDLIKSEDTNGNVIEYLRKAGKLREVRDDLGHVITYSYAGKNLAQIIDEQGTVLVSYDYAQGLLTHVTDRSGHVTRYLYNTDGTLSDLFLPGEPGQTLFARRHLEFRYDPDPTDNTGKTRLLRWLTDAEGNPTFFDYRFDVDNFNKYNGGTTTMTNALGVLRRESNEPIYQDWRLANGYYQLWDPSRNVNEPAFRAQADEIFANHTTTFTYDKNGAILSVTDPRGFTATYEYDALENYTATTDANGHAITQSDDLYFRNLRKDFGFINALTGEGKLVVELTAADIAALTERFTTHFEYDERGNLVKRTDNEDNVTTFTYTDFNKLASETSAIGNALVASDDAFFVQKRADLGFIDPLTGGGKLVAQLTAAEKLSILTLFTTTFTYDASQNLIEIKDPGGDLTRFAYDAFGNATQRTVFLDATDLVTPAKQQVTQFFYDAFGNNVKTIDAEGNTTFASFDHFGNRTSFTDGRGGVTTFTYDNDNRLVTVTDPESHVTVNSYDTVGNRIAVQDAAGHTVISVFDKNNMLLAVQDNAALDPTQNRTTQFQLDVVGHRTEMTDANGHTTSYVYREDNRLIEVITPPVPDVSGFLRQYRTSYDYDAVGNRITVNDNNGNTTQYVYHPSNLTKHVTDALGNVTQYSYDANLNQVQIVIGAHLAEAQRRVLRFSYDEEDQLIAEVDALGATTRHAYDAPGNRISVTDANGRTTDFEYDKNNRLIKEIRPEVIDPRTGLPTRYTVLHQYDTNGNGIATTDENGNASQFTFDKDDRVVLIEDANQIKTVYTYDSRHNRTSVQIGVQAHVDLAGKVIVDGTEDAQVTTFTYDEFNQLIRKTDGVGNALAASDSVLYRNLRRELGFTDPLTEGGKSVAQLTEADKQALRESFTERYTYDKVGNRKTVADNLGRATSFTYDALNRLEQRTDALNQATAFRYDGNGNRLSTTDALGRTTTQAYDTLNRLTAFTDPLGVTTARAYDSFGNLTAETQAAGTLEARTTQFVYDLNNRLIEQTDPEGHTQAFEYDAVGNRLKVIDGRGNATDFVYDALNRNIKIIDPLLFETQFEYDGVGNRITLVDARGGIERLTYDPGNRYVQTQDAQGRITRFAYDVRGNRITQTTAADTPQAEVTTFEYDAENNLRSITDAEGNLTAHDYDRVYNRIATTDGNGHTTSFAFDAINRLLTVTDAEGGTTTYTYDAVGNRLTQTDALGRITTFDYEARNQLISQFAPDGVETRYAYDAVGSRVSITRAANTPLAASTTFTYNRDDQLIAQTDALGNTTRYEYDENHNLARTIDALGNITAYVYDANNRVTSIIDPLGSITTYRYDAVGNRVQVIDALGQTQSSFYDLTGRVVQTVDAEGAAVSYEYDANANRIRMTRFANPVALPVDPTQPPALTLDAARDQVTRFDYDKLNRLVRTVDAEGAVVDTGYDAVGNVLATKAYANLIVDDVGLPLSVQTPVADPTDRLTQFAYDQVNRLIRRTDAEGFSTDFGYDAVGNRLSETLFLSKTDLSGTAPKQVRRFSYDLVNRLDSETSALGVTTRYEYDALGNRTARVTGADTVEARRWQSEYDAVGQLVRELNPEGTATRRVYDAVGRMVQLIEAEGLADEQRITLNAYDANGRLIERTFPDGTRTQFVYDAVGNLIEKIDATASPGARRTTYAYDRMNRLVLETAAPGVPEQIARQFIYDAFGNRTRETLGFGSTTPRVTLSAYDRNNRLIAQTDGVGTTTLFDHDAFGNVIRRAITGTTLDRSGNTVARTQAVSMDYDGRNLVIREQNGASDVIERGYDAAGNLVFDVRGAGTASAATTEYRYDLGNRLIERLVDPIGLGLSTRYEYDLHNNLIAETNARGFTTQTEYDVLNRAALVTDALGFSVSYAYDRFGNQTAITTGQYLVAPTDINHDPAKAAVAAPATTRFAYDAMNRMTYQVDAQGIVTKFAYDERGNRVLKVDAHATLIASGGAITESNMSPFDLTVQRHHQNAYDLVDRLAEEIQPLGTLVRYTYNGAGELASKTVDAGVGVGFKNAVTQNQYDAAGRLQFETNPVGSVSFHEYDAFGNRIRTTEGLALINGTPSPAPTPDARTRAFAYDGANRLIAEITDPSGLNLSTQFEYDARGNQVAIVDAKGARGESVFDAADRVIWQRDGEGNVVSFGYDARGNKISEYRHAASGTGLALGQAPAVTAQDQETTFRHDALDRLIERIDPRGVVNRLAYDAAGNVIEDNQNATGLFEVLPRITHFRYNLANLLTEQIDPAGLKTTFEYDAVYNVVRRSAENRWLDTLNPVSPIERVELQVTDFAYDLNNRLIDQVADPAGLGIRTSYRYDALGNRIVEVTPNAFTALADDSPGAQSVRRGLGLVDAFGNVIPLAQLSAADRQKVIDGFTTRTYFDAAGRPVFTVDALGHVREAQFDAVGNLVRAIQYANPLTEAQRQALDDVTPPAVTPDALKDRTVEYIYDKANREIEVRLDPVRTFVNGLSIDGHRPTTQKAYDGVGNVIREIDANANTTYFYFDSNGQAIGRIDAEDFLTLADYDAFGNLTRETLFLDRLTLLASQKETFDPRSFDRSASNRVIENQYDAGNNPIKTILPPSDLFIAGAHTAEKAQILRSFDAFGNALTETVSHAQSETAPAFKRFAYDTAGRLAAETDARAVELLQSDAAYFVELRRDLGHVNATGQGKLAAELTEAERTAILASFTTTYQYDAANNLRVRTEGDRVTTFEYDRANRNIRIHNPVYERVEVDALGNVLRTADFRLVSDLAYDAGGNLLLESKADGTVIRHEYDRAYRKIASTDDTGIYTEYGYDFSGNRTLVRRYFNPVSDLLNPTRPAAHAADQLITFGYDRVGRLVTEQQHGDFAAAEDDRITQFGYDANGNQVEILDTRGFASKFIYDGMNRPIGTVNPSGGVTATFYDAMGNVIRQQAGGWGAPSLVGGSITESFASQQGILLQWSTSHPTDGLVHVRPAGSTGAFTIVGEANDFAVNHDVYLTGLAADTQYEYHIVAKDAFGHTLTTETRTFRTAPTIGETVLTNLRQEGLEFAVDLSFQLAGTAQNVAVAVGTAADDPFGLTNETLFTPVLQADGRHTVTLRFADPAQALFQIRWDTGSGGLVTLPSAVQQLQELRVFDGRISAAPSLPGAFNLSVEWNLAADFAANNIGTYIDDLGVLRHQVYIGYTFGAEEDPTVVEADQVQGGTFTTTFENFIEGARTLHFYFVRPDGEVVNAAPVSIGALAGLDLRVQRLAFYFPDIDTSAASLQFNFRRVGGSVWSTLPPEAVHGLSADVLGVAEGDYEFEALLVNDGLVVRQVTGSFSLREPGSVANLFDPPRVSDLIDAANGGQPVAHGISGSVFSVPSLLPLNPGESLSLSIIDAAGVTTAYPFDGASFDTAQLARGSYTLNIRKTHSDGVTTTVLNDITGSLTVNSPVTFTLNDNLLSFPDLVPLALNESLTLEITGADGIPQSHPFGTGSFDLTVLDPGDYTLHIQKIRTETVTTTDPATGIQTTTVITTVLNDITGDISIAPRTLTSSESAALVDLRQLLVFDVTNTTTQTVNTFVTGEAATVDHVYSFYDGNGWKLFSNENGGVWIRNFFDGAGNITKEVRFKFRDPVTLAFIDQVVDPGDTPPSIEQLIANYDAAVAAHDPANGVDTIRVVTRAFDAANNRLSETAHSTAHGAVTDEFRYDRFNNTIRETKAKGILNEEDTTVFAYDAFNRATRVTFGPFQFFDSQGNGFFDTVSRTMTYDARGNRSTQTNERGFMERFHHDAQGRLIHQWDPALVLADGSLAPSRLRLDYAYDAFGRLLTRTEVDLTGLASNPERITRFEYDNYDQVVRWTDPAGAATQLAYDRSGNKTAATDARGFTEEFIYDAENRVIRRIDRLGNDWITAYDAYGEKVSETDPNGRVTQFTLGAYGQVLGQKMTLTRDPVAVIGPRFPNSGGLIRVNIKVGIKSFKSLLRLIIQRLVGTSRNIFSGARSVTETNTLDWLGRTTQTTDSFGKHLTYSYDDADRLRVLNDVATGKATTYTYDARGNRRTEQLTGNGALPRDIIYTYNTRSWLTGVDGNLDVAFGGSELIQTANIFFRFDEAGNRVWINDNKYIYDGSNRMRFAYDGKDQVTVEAIEYDGYGNRISETRGATPTTYTYDLGNHVRSSSAGDQWTYDPVGNVLFQRERNGDNSTTAYDAENNATRIQSNTAGGAQTVTLGYDAAGNAGIQRVRGNKFGFDEVTRIDVRYKEQSKLIENSYAKGAKGLRGLTRFVYDANGQLIFLDRGRKRGNPENSTATLTYDNEGHIVFRSDRPTSASAGDFLAAYNTDPDTTQTGDENGLADTLTRQALDTLFSGRTSASTNLRTFLYALGHPVAEARTEHVLSLVKLTLQGGNPIGDENGITGFRVTLLASDIVRDAAGTLDRAATAGNIAARVYLGFGALTPTAQARVVGYVQGTLPLSDAAVQAGSTITLDGFVHVTDGSYQNTALVTDYSFRQIGPEGGPPLGQVLTHTMRTGDTLASLAAAYYGSPSYWYLIAEANGLSGSEPLTGGTTLTIPNTVANSLNDSDTFKIYNESEIIGARSPEITVRKKKRSFFQKLIQIIIIVIIVVAAWYVAQFAVGLFQAAAAPTAAAAGSAAGAVGAGISVGTSLGLVGGGLALVGAGFAAAAAGFLAGYATSFATQGLAILADLQDGFDWKAMRDMGTSFAVTAVAAGAASWAGEAFKGSQLTQSLVKGGIQVSAQYLEHGEITNGTGILLAMLPAADKLDPGRWRKTVSFVEERRNVVAAGLSLLEAEVRGDVNALNWANAALQSVSPRLGVYHDLNPSGVALNWARIGQEALLVGGLSLIVEARFGEDAALNFFGQGIGSLITGVLGEQALLETARRTLGTPNFDAIVSNDALSSAQKLKQLDDLTKFVQAARLRNPAQAVQVEAAPDQRDPEREFTPNAEGRLVDQNGNPARVRLASLTSGDTMSDAGSGFGDVEFGPPIGSTPESEAMFNALVEGLQNPANAGGPPIMLDDFGRPIEEPELESELNAMTTRVRTVLTEGMEASADDIELVQRFLADRGYDLGSAGVDAIFGPRTARAASEYLGALRGEFNLGFGLRANSANVSDHSTDILRDIFEEAGITSATVTSTARDSDDQARVMYDNLVGTGPRQGVDAQRRSYGDNGDQVIDTFEAARRQDKNRDQIIDLMKAKIDELGPTNVSKHASDPSVLNVFDIAPSSIVNPTAFERAVRAAEADGRIRNFLGPRDGDRAYHIEITQPSDEDE